MEHTPAVIKVAFSEDFTVRAVMKGGPTSFAGLEVEV